MYDFVLLISLFQAVQTQTSSSNGISTLSNANSSNSCKLFKYGSLLLKIKKYLKKFEKDKKIFLVYSISDSVMKRKAKLLS